ncbi:YheC/YheD family protein [Mycoplasmatota bacterium]|nr:YheC/YheD family protein [Mycoplasmatota bacterium]
MLVGAMHMRAHPSKISRVYTFAAAAKMEGVEFFYFSPGKVDFISRTIEGFSYENGEWIKKTYPFPKVVINMFKPNTDKQNDIYLRLRDEISYLENPIGDKEDIHRIIMEDTCFRGFLPKTKLASNISNVDEFLNKYKKIVLKPMSGCQGIGILFIEKKSKTYIIYENGSKFVVNSLEEPLKNIDLESYLIQQYIFSETSKGLPVDFRLHTQKNGEGKYILTTIYPRIANVKNKVTNYSQGGYTVDIESYLKGEYDEKWNAIFKYMKVFAIQLAEFINDYYGDDLNELGIDIGLDKNNKIYLYEINWRPGVPIIFRGELDHARNIIKYSEYKIKNF